MNSEKPVINNTAVGFNLQLHTSFLISNWRIFEKRKYPGWFSLSLVIPNIGAVLYLVAIGFVAWKDK